MNLNELKDRAYKTAKSHGWHDKELSDETYLMLIITEIAEAVQADRKGIRPDIEGYKEFVEAHDETAITYAFKKYIKGCVEEELADVVIRCLDLAGLHGLNLPDVPEQIHDIKETEKILGNLTFAEIAFGICGNIFMVGNIRKVVEGVLWATIAYCYWRGIDIDWHVEQKMRYNELRPYRHGGKAY